MTVAEILCKMIDYSNGSHHDINHLMKVHAFAQIIAEREKLSARDRLVTEVAAIVHDIACPLCREKYGRADGRFAREYPQYPRAPLQNGHGHGAAGFDL